MNILYNKKTTKFNCTLVNYANSDYVKLQQKNSKTAIQVGGITKAVSYQPSDIDQEFYRKNEGILDQPRGNGYWLWKPYFVKKALDQINTGDYLFYTDSGSYFVNSVENLILAINASNQDIMPFELSFKQSMWTKRDTFTLMNCDYPEFTESKIRMAGFILIKKSLVSVKFIDEWLFFAQDKRILTDIANTQTKPNYEDFIEHRHDQSIFSLLTKKYNFEAFRDPSQYGNFALHSYKNSKDYSQLVNLTRLKKTSFFYKIKTYFIKCFK